MAETVIPDAPTMYDALGENNKHLRKTAGPRNISPEVMGQYKAQVFGAIMGGGFSVNAELAGWDKYSHEKRAKLIVEMDHLDEIRFVLVHEEDSDLLQAAIVRKRELERVLQLSEKPDRDKE